MRKTYPRAVALTVGTAMMLINGVVYAWSIYSVPFSEGFGWSSAQLGVCFTVMLGSFCLGGVIGGAVANRFGIGFSVPAGGVLGFVGFLLCMFLTAERIWLLFIAFTIAGIGVGFVYNGVIAAVVPRFPDKKGFASGVLLMGYGGSSLVLGSLAAALIGRFFILPPRPKRDTAAQEKPRGLTPAQMLRTRRFWLFFLAAVIGTGFGSGLIAHAQYIFLEGGAEPGLATLGVGLVAVMNGLGRVIFGMLHDRCGFRVSLTLDALIYIAVGLLGYFALSGTTWLLLVSMMAIGACYGAVPTISASVAGEFFGPAHYGRNLSLVNLNILFAAFASTVAGALQTANGSYAPAFLLFVCLEVLALVLLLLLGRTKSIDY